MGSENMLPREIAALVGAELRSGEKITWTAQPIPGRFARKSIPMVLFGIPWTAFALFWTGGALFGTWAVSNSNHGSGFAKLFLLFPCFGLPFIGIGLWMLSSPWWMRCQALRTAYVLTDQRALILEAGWWKKITVRTYLPERLRALTRSENRDGSGDIIFEQQWQSDSNGSRRTIKIGFLAIPNVREVENAVQSLATSAQ